MSTPEELLCSRTWRLRHSAWMLWGILSVGLFWVVGFAYIGVKARNRTWLLIAGGWLIYTIASFTIYTVFDMPEKGEASTPLSSTMGGVGALAWIGGAVLAWFVNRKWLVWRAHNSKKGPWYAAATASGAPSAPATSQQATVDAAFRAAAGVPAASAPAPAATAVPATRASARSPLPPPPPGTLYAPGAEQASAPLDLNSATRDQLAALPGLDAAWADHIISTRDRVGGFGDPSELVTAASVPPHVFAALRGSLTSTPRGAGAPPAATPANKPDGRRLEF